MIKARILILEDDLETLTVILNLFTGMPMLDVSVVVLSEYAFVEKYINPSDEIFDLILLDRDCYLGGSFHILNIEKFGVEKVISISSVPEYNQHALNRGVTKVVHKDYEHLDKFQSDLTNEIRLYFKIQ